MSIPRINSDITYSTMGQLWDMPGQKNLNLGWNNFPKTTYLVSVEDGRYRCQRWDMPYNEVIRRIKEAVDCDSYDALTEDFLDWMYRTFPYQSVKGKLNHLKLEVDEALANPKDIMEFADCFLLSIAAASVAGFTPRQLLSAAKNKLSINKEREWPTQQNPDDPVLHLKNLSA